MATAAATPTTPARRTIRANAICGSTALSGVTHPAIRRARVLAKYNHAPVHLRDVDAHWLDDSAPDGIPRVCTRDSFACVGGALTCEDCELESGEIVTVILDDASAQWFGEMYDRERTAVHDLLFPAGDQ